MTSRQHQDETELFLELKSGSLSTITKDVRGTVTTVVSCMAWQWKYSALGIVLQWHRKRMYLTKYQQTFDVLRVSQERESKGFCYRTMIKSRPQNQP